MRFKQNNQWLRDADDKIVSIPLFRWLTRSESQISLFCTLFAIDDYLIPYYRGIITLTFIPRKGRVRKQVALEIALPGGRSLCFYFAEPWWIPIGKGRIRILEELCG